MKIEQLAFNHLHCVLYSGVRYGPKNAVY